jgi:hypothetical protein
MSCGSVVGKATGYTLNDQGVGVRFSVLSRFFKLSISSGPALGPIQPPIQWVPETLCPGLKRQGHEADHSSPTSVEVKKTLI